MGSVNTKSVLADSLVADAKRKASKGKTQTQKQLYTPLSFQFQTSVDTNQNENDNMNSSLSTLEKLIRYRTEFEKGINEHRLESEKVVLEGTWIKPKKWAGHNIGVWTSGGDSQGMNAAVRAIVRFGLYLGCKVFYIHEGYQGMVEGGHHIQEATWGSTSNIINVGGTIIGSARCLDFKERWARLKAAKNLLHHRINNLICIGGDGSLTGANMFRQEWPSLLRELIDTAEITPPEAHFCEHLNICGLVGSIDNDFCGTDLTIGTNSALHRILGAVDDITTTAVSHRIAFIVEVMGRMCGFLPLLAGIASEASAIFIPEDPWSTEWKAQLCDILHQKQKGEERRTHIILVAEGAQDRKGNPIKVIDVKEVVSKQCGMDSRVTVLGHVQRGGNASAMDRLLASRQGAAAVLTLQEATPTTPAYVIGIDGYDIVRLPLMKAVEKTKMIAKEMAEGNFDDVVKIRGSFLLNSLYVYLMTQNTVTHRSLTTNSARHIPHRIGIVMVGSPACGMNSCTRGFVSICLSYGYQPVLIHNGWSGLSKDDQTTLAEWKDVQFWTKDGGSNIGTRPDTAKATGLRSIAHDLAKHRISGIVIVGGFEAFESACQLLTGRATYPELCIPITVVPATIANNVPGCDFSLGADTALNQICKACDDLKQSAKSVQKCVYVVEVGGDYCGYLATMAGIATGADATYIKEEPFTVNDIKEKVKFFKNKFRTTKVKQGLLLRNEKANPNITLDVMYRIMAEEGMPDFQTRQVVLGYTQEGNSSSPHDRYWGVEVGVKSASWIIKTMEKCGAKEGNYKVYTNDPDTVTVQSKACGDKRQTEMNSVPVASLIEKTNFRYRRPKNQWWMRMRVVHKILASIDAVIDDMPLAEEEKDSVVFYDNLES